VPTEINAFSRNAHSPGSNKFMKTKSPSGDLKNKIPNFS